MFKYNNNYRTQIPHDKISTTGKDITIFVSIISSLIGAIFGAVATISTSGFGYLNKNRELDIKMVEVGLSILNGKKTESSIPARDFAISLLEKYSGVKSSYREVWVKSGDLPYDPDLLIPYTFKLTRKASNAYQKCLASLDHSDPDYFKKEEECNNRYGIHDLLKLNK